MTWIKAVCWISFVIKIILKSIPTCLENCVKKGLNKMLHCTVEDVYLTSFQIRFLSFFFPWKTWTRHGFWRETKKMTQQFIQFGIYLKPRWLTKEASLVTLLPWTVQNSQTSLYLCTSMWLCKNLWSFVQQLVSWR